MEYSDLIGVPFKYGGRGGSFDCYGLIRELLHRRGIEVPDYQSPTNQYVIGCLMAGELRLWKRVDDETLYSIMLVRIGVNNSHVAMYLGENKFIHTYEASGGVCVERLSDWRQRVEGFYQYAAN